MCDAWRDMKNATASEGGASSDERGGCLHHQSSRARRRPQVGCSPARSAGRGYPGWAGLPGPDHYDSGLTLIRAYSVPGTVGAIVPVEGDEGWVLAAGRG